MKLFLSRVLGLSVLVVSIPSTLFAQTTLNCTLGADIPGAQSSMPNPRVLTGDVTSDSFVYVMGNPQEQVSGTPIHWLRIFTIPQSGTTTVRPYPIAHGYDAIEMAQVREYSTNSPLPTLFVHASTQKLVDAYRLESNGSPIAQTTLFSSNVNQWDRFRNTIIVRYPNAPRAARGIVSFLTREGQPWQRSDERVVKGVVECRNPKWDASGQLRCYSPQGVPELVRQHSWVETNHPYDPYNKLLDAYYDENNQLNIVYVAPNGSLRSYNISAQTGPRTLLANATGVNSLEISDSDSHTSSGLELAYTTAMGDRGFISLAATSYGQNRYFPASQWLSFTHGVFNGSYVVPRLLDIHGSNAFGPLAMLYHYAAGVQLPGGITDANGLLVTDSLQRTVGIIADADSFQFPGSATRNIGTATLIQTRNPWHKLVLYTRIDGSSGATSLRFSLCTGY